jgi:hypothetical protein
MFHLNDLIELYFQFSFSSKLGKFITCTKYATQLELLVVFNLDSFVEELTTKLWMQGPILWILVNPVDSTRLLFYTQIFAGIAYISSSCHGSSCHDTNTLEGGDHIRQLQLFRGAVCQSIPACNPRHGHQTGLI